MNKKEVSLKLIANNLNLSINTVSHALRDLNDISIETKEKVIKKANELGYVMKKRKSAKKKKRVAFLINSFSNLYYNIISSELSKMFSASENFEFFIIYNDLQFITEEDLDELFRYNPNLIISHIASLSLEDEPIIELVEQYIASLQFYQQLKNESLQQLLLFLS